MNTTELLSAIDHELAQLQQVRSLLAGGGENIPSLNKKRGGKRFLSAEARAKISAAQKKRWAKQKKAAKG